jgi:two-component system heavy metal sensor histidine kinase CusS
VSAYSRGPWRLYIGSLLEPSERLLREYVRVSLLLGAGVAGMSLFLGYGFSRATLRPIRAIEATANRIRADNLAARIPMPNGKDELASLTALLNQMFDRLQSSFEQVGRFTADASHELKTPLALIRLNAERLLPHVSSDPDGNAAIAEILEEITRLQQVIDRLLFLAKSDGGALAPAQRAVEVSSLLSDLCPDAQALAEEKGARFELTRNDAGTIHAEPELILQLLLNLITNAVAASPAGGQITLDSARTDAGWTFTLTDEGLGLTPVQLSRVFERFVRFGNAHSQTPSHKGHGLGLAICKSIVELHRGRIRIENRTDRSGLRVVVDLPYAEAAPPRPAELLGSV